MTGSRRVHHDPKSASVLSKVEAQYSATRDRLSGNHEYERLRESAEAEAARNPKSWLNRNRIALYVETRTPMIGISIEPSPDRVGVFPYLTGFIGIIPVVLVATYLIGEAR